MGVVLRLAVALGREKESVAPSPSSDWRHQQIYTNSVLINKKQCFSAPLPSAVSFISISVLYSIYNRPGGPLMQVHSLHRPKATPATHIVFNIKLNLCQRKNTDCFIYAFYGQLCIFLGQVKTVPLYLDGILSYSNISPQG